MTDQSARQSLEVDIACVGFGPAMGGFLTTLSSGADGLSAYESKAVPGLPLQVVCYERADDIGFGVSGVVSRARSIKQSLPEITDSPFPLSCQVKCEKVVYLLDPIGASRRPLGLRLADRALRTLGRAIGLRDSAFELPYIPPFLRKDGGVIFSIGQFNQWVGTRLMGSGAVQLWPGTPVSTPLLEGRKVVGIRLVDQGTDKAGSPAGGYMPGMDILARLTVVGDGPVGAVGQALDESLGLPEGHKQHDWAVGMKMLVELPESSALETGTVLHTFGFPEPEIFGFLYVFPDRLASLGIFVPSWFDSPVRTSYRYLQHWIQHPYLWRHLKGGKLRSWGAKTLQESGMRGEPVLAGDGFARIGEGSGSTNVLTGSGVDEAWETGVLLAQSVIEILKQGAEFSAEELRKTYINTRRKSWIEREGRIASRSRDGFQRGFLRGMLGMGLSGITGGLINLTGDGRRPHERIPSLEDYTRGRIPVEEISAIREAARLKQSSLHDAVMDRMGWPRIEFDGELLMSHQDALLLGGKVQAAGGYADHVAFVYPKLCESCGDKVCIEVCSGQAITAGESGGVPEFDREKCVHCGACIWNCSKARESGGERSNIEFRAGSGGLHSAEN